VTVDLHPHDHEVLTVVRRVTDADDGPHRGIGKLGAGQRDAWSAALGEFGAERVDRVVVEPRPSLCRHGVP
jgi:hypothetical protein